jgi:endoglycosylceramidase
MEQWVRTSAGLRKNRLAAIAAIAMFVAVLATACVASGAPPAVRDPGESTELQWLKAVRGSQAGIYDTAGRQVLLRGTNFNHLGDYFSTDPSLPTVATLDETDWADAAAQGMNVVRLVTNWSAWEPVRDQIDLTYLARVRSAVSAANAHGIYVVIDMHQDAWSKFVFTPADEVCPAGTSHQVGWDGAPAWATMTDNYPTCTPGGRENSPAVRAAWENFYRNTAGVRDELAELWGFIATEFAEDAGVAGFDLLNEPGYGFDQNITLVGLAQFYAAAIAEIRAAELQVNAAAGPVPSRPAPGHIVFFEPTVNGPFVATEFSADPNLVFAPHNYGESIIGGGIPGFLDLITGALQTLARAYGTTTWIGEYGTFNNDRATGTAYMSRFNRLDDRNPGAGGTWWQWEQQCGDPHNVSYPPTAEWLASQQQNCTEAPRMNTPCTARSYPRAMPGRLSSVVAEPCGGALSVSGRTSASSTAVLWFQSDSVVPPTVTGRNIGDSNAVQSRGGWRVTVQVSGDYQISLT